MKDIKEIRVGGFRWAMAAEILSSDVERITSVLARSASDGHSLTTPSLALRAGREATITRVKHAPHRTVYHVPLPALDLYVKHYRGGPREWWRCLFRGPRAAREFALSREVARRGVPTLEVLGFGRSDGRFGPADSFLFTRTMPDVRPLLDFLESDLPALPPSRRARVQQQLARAVGRLLAAQHRAGVCHDDLHPGNLLLRFAAGEPRLYLIDLDRVRLSGPLGLPASRANLVLLDRWFALRFSRGDRCRAFRAYCESRPDLDLDERHAARDLATRTFASLLLQTRNLDGRCLGGNRHYVRLRAPGLSGHAVSDLDAGALLSDPDAAFARPEAKILKRSASSVVAELPGGRILKRVAARPGTSLLRTPPALRSYRLGHAFRLRGLPTPRPLAVWHRRRLGLCREGYLLVEKVPEALNLRGFVEGLASRPDAERNARLWPVLDELGRLVRRLHEWGFSHRDLKAANLLVSPVGWAMSTRGLRSAEAGGDHVWLIDLAGVRRLGKVGRSRRVRDLARLHMSFLDHPALTKAERLRFLRSYLAWGLRGKAGWKGWWVGIDREARAKAARTAARGRVVG
jgi:tRNA A-37 threonylcarbamoyl transferase component Bud32